MYQNLNLFDVRLRRRSARRGRRQIQTEISCSPFLDLEDPVNRSVVAVESLRIDRLQKSIKPIELKPADLVGRFSTTVREYIQGLHDSGVTGLVGDPERFADRAVRSTGQTQFEGLRLPFKRPQFLLSGLTTRHGDLVRERVSQISGSR
jgi:hypothetical protein